jgi:hypothetical protein
MVQRGSAVDDLVPSLGEESFARPVWRYKWISHIRAWRSPAMAVKISNQDLYVKVHNHVPKRPADERRTSDGALDSWPTTYSGRHHSIPSENRHQLVTPEDVGNGQSKEANAGEYAPGEARRAHWFDAALSRRLEYLI